MGGPPSSSPRATVTSIVLRFLIQDVFTPFLLFPSSFHSFHFCAVLCFAWWNSFHHLFTDISLSRVGIKWLLKKGARLDERDHTGNTPLLWAAADGHFELVQWLLLNGSSIEERDFDGNTVFHAVTRNGHIDLLQWFINQGYDLHSVVNSRLQTILDTALQVEDKTQQQTHVSREQSEHDRYVEELHQKKRAMLCFLISRVLPCYVILLLSHDSDTHRQLLSHLSPLSFSPSPLL